LSFADIGGDLFKFDFKTLIYLLLFYNC